MTKTCVICGKEFESRSDVRILCSRKCAEKNLSEPKGVKTCVICGKEFDVKINVRTLTCSGGCSKARKKVTDRIRNRKRYKRPERKAYLMEYGRKWRDRKHYYKIRDQNRQQTANLFQLLAVGSVINNTQKATA